MSCGSRWRWTTTTRTCTDPRRAQTQFQRAPQGGLSPGTDLSSIPTATSSSCSRASCSPGSGGRKKGIEWDSPGDAAQPLPSGALLESSRPGPIDRPRLRDRLAQHAHGARPYASHILWAASAQLVNCTAAGGPTGPGSILPTERPLRPRSADRLGRRGTDSTGPEFQTEGVLFCAGLGGRDTQFWRDLSRNGSSIRHDARERSVRWMRTNVRS